MGRTCTVQSEREYLCPGRRYEVNHHVQRPPQITSLTLQYKDDKKNLFCHHDNSCSLIAIVTRRILLALNQTRGEQAAKAPLRKSHHCSHHSHHHGGCWALCCWQCHPAHLWALSRPLCVFPSHWMSCPPLTALQNQAHLSAGVPQLYT